MAESLLPNQADDGPGSTVGRRHIMTRTDTLVPVRALLEAWAVLARKRAGVTGRSSRLKVFLDCDAWFEDRVRSDVDFVTFIADHDAADVCISATLDGPPGTERNYRVRFVGAGRFRSIEASARISLGPSRANVSRSDPGSRSKRRPAAFAPSHVTV
jgi:hypothetical protein